jgi:putative ABC transport system ATP-binding protein
MSSRPTPPVPPGPGTPPGGSGGSGSSASSGGSGNSGGKPDAPVPAPVSTAAATAPVLRLEALTRVHGSGATEVHALRGIDLEVYPGELVAVMGPSGSGKSTLLTIAGGLDLPTSGRVVVEGTDLTTATRKELAALRRRSIGYVFQDYNLIPALTAAENVALPRELDGTGARKARREAVAALRETGLGDLADRFPDEMSGGQQQRVAIARALVGDRRLVLADEPTGALDSETGDAVLALLRTRCDAGAAGILVTHEPRFAAWADRVVFLRDGSVVDMTLRSSAESLLTGGAVQ